MSFKINRIKSEKESYRTTVDWLNDFSKSANFQDRVRERRDAPAVEKFSTIEDKMKDMKARVGFENLKNISANKNEDFIFKSAEYNDSSKKTCKTCEVEGCECEIVKTKDGTSCKICKKIKTIESDESLIMLRKKIESLLVYVDQLIGDRNYTTKAEVYNHCMSNPNLEFGYLSSKMDQDKFGKYMDGLFKKNISNIDPSGAEYTPISENNFDTSGDDMLPSYYNAFSL